MEVGQNRSATLIDHQRSRSFDLVTCQGLHTLTDRKMKDQEEPSQLDPSMDVQCVTIGKDHGKQVNAIDALDDVCRSQAGELGCFVGVHLIVSYWLLRRQTIHWEKMVHQLGIFRGWIARFDDMTPMQQNCFVDPDDSNPPPSRGCPFLPIDFEVASLSMADKTNRS